MVAFAADLLAGGDPCFASFSDSLASDASFETGRHNRERIFPVHQGPIHAPRQSPRRLKTIIHHCRIHLWCIFLYNENSVISAKYKVWREYGQQKETSGIDPTGISR